MIVIIGAGLSGLLTAYRLKQADHRVIILEARDRIGGRIHTLHAAIDTPVEMGATWFGPMHTELLNLLEELHIDYFDQYLAGTSYFQAFSTAPVQAVELPQQESSFRIKRGTSEIINKLSEFLDGNEIITNQTVNKIESDGIGINISTKNKTYKADKVIVCLPPKLISEKIEFKPPLPSSLQRIMSETQTWMEGSTKVALVYEQPFWLNRGLSGAIFSNVGPVTEFYDHSNHDLTKFALCGFVSSGYSALTFEARKQNIIKQLTLIYGNDATNYIDYHELYWGNEIFTSNHNGLTLYPHQNNGHAVYRQGFLKNTVYISNTETSAQYGGYMEGAVRSANKIAQRLLNTT